MGNHGGYTMSQNFESNPDILSSEWLGGEALIGGLPRQRWKGTIPSIKTRVATAGVALVFVSGIVLGLVSSLCIVLPRKSKKDR